jgi:hypothetical protein
MTRGKFASLYRCGTAWMRIEEGAKTEVSSPELSGSKACTRGSALYRMVDILGSVVP